MVATGNALRALKKQLIHTPKAKVREDTKSYTQNEEPFLNTSGRNTKQ